MPDHDGYPTDDELLAIREYDVIHQPVMGLVDLIGACWNWGIREGWLNKKRTRLYLATGGWSGNEEIIEALQDNLMFWSCCWYMSKSGGAFWFHLDKAPNRGRGFKRDVV